MKRRALKIVAMILGVLRFVCVIATPVLAQERPDLVEPPSVASQYGVLNLELVAASGTINLAGKTYRGQFYNDVYMPP